MHRKNIDLIMQSDLWETMTHNKCFRGYKITDSVKRPECREGGFGFCLIVFFKSNSADRTLIHYRQRGNNLVASLQSKLYGGHEYLEPERIQEFYNLKAVVFC